MADILLSSKLSSVNFHKIKKYISKAAEIESDCIENYILGARVYIKQSALMQKRKVELYNLAVDFLNKALKYDLENTAVKLMLAEIYININNYDLADSYLDDILKLKSNSRIFELKGVCSFHKKNYLRALEYFSKALNIQPRNHLIIYQKAYCLMLNKNYSDSFYECAKALILKPSYVPARKLQKVILSKASGHFKKSKNSILTQYKSMINPNVLENELFNLTFDKDALTGFYTGSSLRIFVDQCKIIDDLKTVTVIIRDLRTLSLIMERTAVNDLIKNIACDIKDLLTEAVFISRPTSDRVVVFIKTNDSSKAVNVLEKALSKYNKDTSIIVSDDNYNLAWVA